MKPTSLRPPRQRGHHEHALAGGRERPVVGDRLGHGARVDERAPLLGRSGHHPAVVVALVEADERRRERPLVVLELDGPAGQDIQHAARADVGQQVGERRPRRRPVVGRTAPLRQDRLDDDARAQRHVLEQPCPRDAARVGARVDDPGVDAVVGALRAQRRGREHEHRATDAPAAGAGDEVREADRGEGGEQADQRDDRHHPAPEVAPLAGP